MASFITYISKKIKQLSFVKYSLILMVLCLLNSDVVAQPVETPTNDRILVAEKATRFRFYLPGARLHLKRRGIRKQLRGKLIQLTDSSVVIRRRRELYEVPVHQITAIKKVDPRLRLAFGFTGAVALSGALLLAARATSISALFLIPVTAAGVYSLGAVPASFLVEEFEKKHEKRGWQFSVQPKSWLKRTR